MVGRETGPYYQNEEPCEFPPGAKAKCPHAEAAAVAAVKKTFAILGVDVDRPDQVKEFQDSLRFGDKLRRRFERSILPVFFLILGFIGVAFIAGLEFGVKSLVP